METADQLKKLVKAQYTEIAEQDKASNQSSCCGSGCCSDEVYNIMSEDYAGLKGYNPDADLGLGCGLPTQFARIRKGDTVLDLGSGAGNDCFIARAETGDTGKVIGVDMTEAMIAKARANAEKLGLNNSPVELRSRANARANAEKLGLNNVEFRLGEIEALPVGVGTIDVVVSNCVLNLVPDKKKAFSEINRVLKPGGHFSISDIVLVGELPDSILKTAELYAGCVAGAIQKDAYLGIVREAGFENITLQKEKAISIPDDILAHYLSPEQLEEFKHSGTGIYSITVYAEKKKDACCDKDTCCK